MKRMSHQLREEKFDDLASALGDTPETVIEGHQLRRRQCRAFLLGEPGDFSAAIVQSLSQPAEPCGFGGDPDAMYDLLQEVKEWKCICVPSDIAGFLGRRLESQSGFAVSYLDDIYHVANKEIPVPRHPAVRQLSPTDLPLLQSAPAELRGSGFKDATEMLQDGIVAAAIVSGELVSLAHVSAFSERYADVAVVTREDHRGRGYATAVASIITNLVLRRGLVPVWSCGENNEVSLRIAERLGFREVNRKRYVIVGDQ